MRERGYFSAEQQQPEDEKQQQQRNFPTFSTDDHGKIDERHSFLLGHCHFHYLHFTGNRPRTVGNASHEGAGQKNTDFTPTISYGRRERNFHLRLRRSLDVQ